MRSFFWRCWCVVNILPWETMVEDGDRGSLVWPRRPLRCLVWKAAMSPTSLMETLLGGAGWQLECKCEHLYNTHTYTQTRTNSISITDRWTVMLKVRDAELNWFNTVPEAPRVPADPWIRNISFLHRKVERLYFSPEAQPPSRGVFAKTEHLRIRSWIYRNMKEPCGVMIYFYLIVYLRRLFPASECGFGLLVAVNMARQTPTVQLLA